MDPVAAPLAVTIGIMGAVIGNAVEAISGDGSAVPSSATLTQLGVTGACIVVAWFMLRRSDQRDKTAQDEVTKARHAEEKARLAAYRQVEMRADAERKRADAAEERAELLRHRLTEAYSDDGPEQV